MPRNGDGSSDNAIEAGKNIIHGAGEETSTRVSRADKAAPVPEHEKGAGLEGMNASGGQSQGLTHGPEAGQGGRSTKN
ncbi:hypothetical protein B0H66DRAFT_598195 [Apodospora peruviana]|uniref:Uncharacterized protein n=1 Tax=Apodospora peruviana TaxID=516989 RepID=A0AAE0IU77_9PEZI|nr:hypothetical protein B0H66DRAFT_598195 [Apodospora peruviana]